MDRARSLPLPAGSKMHLIRGKAYAMGLHKAEATPLNVATGQMLRTKAADALVGERQSMRAPEAVLSLVGRNGLDLDTEVLWRRARLLRRARHARPDWRENVGFNLDAARRRPG